jgi:ABC-type transport system involved in multi-copper enzyme maturation permease subunit
MSAPAPETGFDPERHARRLAPAGALLAVTGGCVGGGLGLLLAAVGVLLLLLACVSRRDGLLLLGPFARSELARAARTRRTWLWRSVYALAAGAILVGNVYTYASESVTLSGAGVPTDRLGYINQQVTNWFAIGLFGYVCVLTVQLMAPVVAEEREAKRWDALLTTDLRAREILLGKAVGRLPFILDPVLASLPMLALTPLLGGVSPKVMAWAAVATLALVLGLSGVALFCSVSAPTAQAAVGRTAGLVIAYLIASGALSALAVAPQLWHYPSSAGVASPVEFGDVVEAVSAGNPVAAAVSPGTRAKVVRGEFEDEIARAARRFAVFQVTGFGLFGLAAVAWLRPAVRRPKSAPVATARPVRAVARRPPVGEMPVYWWQRYGALGPRRIKLVTGLTARRYVGIGLVAVVVFVAVRAVDAVWPAGPDRVVQSWRMWTATALWAMTCAAMFPPAFRAAWSVARERAAGTLDPLRLTELTPRDILFQKWLGSAASVLPLVLAIMTIAAAGVLTGFVHPLTLAGLAIVVPVTCGVGAAVGLFFSVTATTPGKAVRNMLLAAVVLGQGVVFAFPPALTALVVYWGASDGVVSRDVVGAAMAIAVGAGVCSAGGWLAWRTSVWLLMHEWRTPPNDRSGG